MGTRRRAGHGSHLPGRILAVAEPVALTLSTSAEGYFASERGFLQIRCRRSGAEIALHRGSIAAGDVTRIDPSLEDVFVTLTREQDA